MLPVPILSTKLYIPPPRPSVVVRPRLIQRLNEGLASGCKLTLISASAGFGKTTLVSRWIHAGVRSKAYGVGEECEAVQRAVPTPSVAWLSLDQGDNDPARFLVYLVAALQTVDADIGQGALRALHSPQPPPAEAVLTSLINEIAAISDRIILVLDDYHVVESEPVDQAITFLLEHQPPHMHLVIATRENPQLPLARYRAQGQLTELRSADLRFNSAEAAEFLSEVMGLGDLSMGDIAALESRTEGWIAGLQLAAISLRGHEDPASFIESFTGSHHFVLDYLVEQVLQQQPAGIQSFLLQTSVLERLCGSLCDSVVGTRDLSLETSLGQSPVSGLQSQETLEHLESTNLFIIPLDDQRHWYRYHHLFAAFLRQRLHQSAATEEYEGPDVAELHARASQWYEDNGLPLEAFHHAAAANDVERAEHLIGHKGMPLHFRGTVTTVQDWIESVPTSVLEARPSLGVRHATLSLVAGQTTGVEERLQAAEAALPTSEMDDRTRDLIGQIAAARATLGLTKYQPETMIAQSRRALEYLRPDNLTFRFTAYWTMANAHLLLGDRAAAGRAYEEAVSISQTSGDMFSTMLAAGGLGEVQELENQLHAAADTYRRVLQLSGDQPLPAASEGHLGLARVLYEWNDLDGAQQHGEQSLPLAHQYDSVIDRFIICEVFLARLKLAQGDVAGAAAMLAETAQSVRQKQFVHRMPEVAAAQVLVLLRQGDLEAAANLAQTHNLPLSQARVHLAKGDTEKALAVLGPLRQEIEAKGWQDEQLKVMVLQAVALYVQGEKDEAVQVLGGALALSEPGGFVRTFVDEGAPMAHLVSEAAAQGVMPDYARRLLAAFEAEAQRLEGKSGLDPGLLPPGVRPLIEPLTPREREVLQLMATGHSNPEIAAELVIAVTTVKTHVKNIYGKLQVTNRFQAAARAQDLGLLQPTT